MLVKCYVNATFGTRCATAAFYIIFFIYPSVTAKVTLSDRTLSQDH